MAPMVKRKKQVDESAGDDEDGIMKKEVRRKQKAFDFIKVILKYAFSQVGIIFLCVFYAAGGANLYMAMEEPLEMERFAAKTEITNEIYKMEDFMAEAYWNYIHHKYPEKRLNETAFEVKDFKRLTVFDGLYTTT